MGKVSCQKEVDVILFLVKWFKQVRIIVRSPWVERRPGGGRARASRDHFSPYLLIPTDPNACHQIVFCSELPLSDREPTYLFKQQESLRPYVLKLFKKSPSMGDPMHEMLNAELDKPGFIPSLPQRLSGLEPIAILSARQAPAQVLSLWIFACWCDRSWKPRAPHT